MCKKSNDCFLVLKKKKRILISNINEKPAADGCSWRFEKLNNSNRKRKKKRETKTKEEKRDDCLSRGSCGNKNNNINKKNSTLPPSIIRDIE